MVVPNDAVIFLSFFSLVGIIILGYLLFQKKEWFRMMITTFSLVAIMVGMAFFAWRSFSSNPEIQVAVRAFPQNQSVVVTKQLESETARRTAIQTRIEILEKELEAELEQSSELSEAKPESQKQQLSPSDAAVAGKDKKKDSGKQLEEKKKLLEKAKQELQKEREKSLSKPRWLAEYLVIEKKNWQNHLAHPETIPDRFVISSGRFTTIKEAKIDANRLAKVTISAKLKAFTGQTAVKYDEAWYQSILSRTYDEKLQVKIFNGSPSTMHREHLLVDINPEKVAALLPELRETIVETRIYTAAGGVVGIMLASGLLSVVLSRRKD